jgi:hypothetical protein
MVATMIPAVNESIPRSIRRWAAMTSRSSQNRLPLSPSNVTVPISTTMNATTAGPGESRVTPTSGGRKPRRPSRTSTGDSVASTRV